MRNLTVFVVLGVLFVGAQVMLAGPRIPRVLIYQDKPEEWADALKIGFERELDARKVHVTYVTKLVGDDAGNNDSVSGIASEDYALIYALGTQASTKLFATVHNKPIVFGAVTDPVKAGLFNGNLAKPNGEITGTSDRWPYGAQFKLMKELVPRLKTLGVIYNPDEVNGRISVNFARGEAQKLRIRVLERRANSSTQVSSAVASLLQQC
jgi:putative ABC transport system substrate-binding protein